MSTFDVDSLSDLAAMAALSYVTNEWFARRGREANTVLRLTEKYAQRNDLSLPDWATDAAEPSTSAGEAARFALKSLLASDDAEVQAWTRSSIEKSHEIKAQVIDPLSIGLILGGLILASRVKSIGPDGLKFYKGIPEELAKVLKAGASFFGKLGS